MKVNSLSLYNLNKKHVLSFGNSKKKQEEINRLKLEAYDNTRNLDDISVMSLIGVLTLECVNATNKSKKMTKSKIASFVLLTIGLSASLFSAFKRYNYCKEKLKNNNENLQ